MPTIRLMAPIIIASPAPLCGTAQYPTSRKTGPPKKRNIPNTIRCLARCLTPRLDRRRSSLMISTAFSVAMPLSWSIRRSSSSLTKPDSMPSRTRVRRKSSHSVALGRNVRHLGQTPISGLKLIRQFGHSTSIARHPIGRTPMSMSHNRPEARKISARTSMQPAFAVATPTGAGHEDQPPSSVSRPGSLQTPFVGAERSETRRLPRSPKPAT